MKLLLLFGIFLTCLQAVLSRKNDDQTLNFLVLGDWGGQPDPPYTTEAETSIAAVMGNVAASEKSKFTLALGDNFYDTGVKNVNDPRFNYTFEVAD
jgi:tartrate-resistant acid phosphatase type 5